MKTLVVGGGSREHAIVWKLAQSPLVGDLYAAPGNAGTDGLARNVAIAADDVEGLLGFALDEGIGLTVVGPEQPLALGIADRFRERGMLIFGPTRAAARIEGSKLFAKRLMAECGVATAGYAAFTDYDDARAYVSDCPIPVAVKADGLAAGKGVVLARTRGEALEAVRAAMDARAFGAAGDCVLVEEFMRGQEVSVFAFVDGGHVSPMVAACDYKRVGDGDTGPNTGGMGSFSPPAGAHWNEGVAARVRETIMQPIADGLVRMGCPYQGVLYLGMMLVDDGCGDVAPKVVEFNCRLGDPETQVVLPRLKTDLAAAMLATARGELAGAGAIEWDGGLACVGVVVASGGYPGEYATGHRIMGLDDYGDGALVFHAGTRLGDGGDVLTDGGRVVTAVGAGAALGAARAAAYGRARRIRFEGAHYRTDIAAGVGDG